LVLYLILSGDWVLTLREKGDDIFIPAQKHYEIETFLDGSIMTISDAIWPGLTPDLLSVFSRHWQPRQKVQFLSIRKCLKAVSSLLIN